MSSINKNVRQQSKFPVDYFFGVFSLTFSCSTFYLPFTINYHERQTMMSGKKMYSLINANKINLHSLCRQKQQQAKKLKEEVKLSVEHPETNYFFFHLLLLHCLLAWCLAVCFAFFVCCCCLREPPKQFIIVCICGYIAKNIK